MEPIDGHTISAVIEVLIPERAALLELLAGLAPDEWERTTECPAYSVKGIASHVLGDDLSLLSRQRDGALPGLFVVAEKMPGADFRALLDAFNDQWVEATRFLSGSMLIELLRWSGEQTAAFYEAVDPMLMGEPVPMFAPPAGEGSPFWQAIGREYLERWSHHSQIRRALGRSSLADAPFLSVGARVVAAIVGESVMSPDTHDGDWSIGPVVLGPTAQAADVLTLAFTQDEVRRRLRGPSEPVAAFAARVARRPAVSPTA